MMAFAEVGTGSKVISFKLGGSLFGIDILDVQEVMRGAKATRLFRSAPFVEGIIDFRGEVIPLIHLGKRLDLAAPPMGDGVMVIVVELRGERVGLVVDSVSQIVTLTDDQASSPPPEMAGLRPEYIRGLSKTEEGLLIVLDLEKVLFPAGSLPPKKPEPKAEAEEVKVSRPSPEAVPPDRPPKLGEMPSLSSFLSPKLRDKVERPRLQKPPSAQPRAEVSPRPLRARRPPAAAKQDLPPPREEIKQPPPPVEPMRTAPPSAQEKVRETLWEEAPLDLEKPAIPSAEEKVHEIVWEELPIVVEWEKPLEEGLHEIVWEEPPYETTWEEELLDIKWEEPGALPLGEKLHEIVWEKPLLEMEWEKAALLPTYEKVYEIVWERPAVPPVREMLYEIRWEEHLPEIEWEKVVEPSEEISVAEAIPVVDWVEGKRTEKAESHEGLAWWVSPIEIIKDLSIGLSWGEEKIVTPGAAQISDEEMIEGYLEEVLYNKLAGGKVEETSLPPESLSEMAPQEPDVAGVRDAEKTIIDEFLGDL